MTGVKRPDCPTQNKATHEWLQNAYDVVTDRTRRPNNARDTGYQILRAQGETLEVVAGSRIDQCYLPDEDLPTRIVQRFSHMGSPRNQLKRLMVPCSVSNSSKSPINRPSQPACNFGCRLWLA